MSTRWRAVAVSTAFVLSLPAPGRTEPHIVAPAEVRARILAAHAERQHHLQALESLLATPAAAAAAQTIGVSAADLKAKAARLSDAELQDLAARARALQTDPVAGTNAVWIVLGVIGAIVVLMILILLVACASGGCED